MTESLIIEPGMAERHYWRDLWRYRELFFVLAWRDVAVRYKQTVIGLAWALIQPLLAMVVLTVIFGKLAKMPAEGTAPYALLVYAGLLPWQYFATSLTGASGSLIGNANLISKVYYPDLVLACDPQDTAKTTTSVAPALSSKLIVVAITPSGGGPSCLIPPIGHRVETVRPRTAPPPRLPRRRSWPEAATARRAA
jgi:lipopolysaccharide transport system permease protein